MKNIFEKFNKYIKKASNERTLKVIARQARVKYNQAIKDASSESDRKMIERDYHALLTKIINNK